MQKVLRLKSWFLALDSRLLHSYSFSGFSLFRKKNVEMPTSADIEVARIALPITYWRRLFLISSKLSSLLKILLSPCTKGEPKNREAAITKGINGGRLTLDATKARTLFSLKRTDSEMTRSVWNPQNGEKPINTPSA